MLNNNTLLTSAKTRARKLMAYYLFVLMFFFAITSTMVGNLVSEITRDYSLNNSQIGLIGSIQNVGGFIAMLLGGLLSDRFSKSRLIGISFFTYTVFLYLVGALPPYILLLGCFMMLGMASNYLSLLIGAYLAEMFGDKRDHYLNLSHAFYGIGSLAGPLYATILTGQNIGWNDAFIRLGIVCTIVAAVFVGLSRRVGEVAPVKESGTREPLARLITDSRVALISLCCLVYMGQQSACSLWVTTYTLDRVTDNLTLAGIVLVGYWGGVVAGRLLQSAISSKVDYRKWLMNACLISAVMICLALAINNIYVMLVVMALSGALTGAAFPSLIGMGCSLFPSRTGAVSSVVCLFGSLGGIVFTWAVGIINDSWGHLAGMATVPASLVVCSALMFMLIKKDGAK